ncbi:MAG: transcriptional regulator [Anaerolineales bacterium]|nr:transcriptional regulator [Anaerolineales bacterium]MCK4976161.1 transcriptional regulator [Anaerolineales bacterium]
MTDYSFPTQLDRMIHNPGRLAIMAVLAGCVRADFTFLEKTTELNKGTLSKHLSALEESGYIEITKSFKGKLPNTSLQLTPQGRKAFKKYRKQYQEFLKSVDEG